MPKFVKLLIKAHFPNKECYNKAKEGSFMTEDVMNDSLNEDQKLTDEVILQLKPLIFHTISDDDIIKFIHL